MRSTPTARLVVLALAGTLALAACTTSRDVSQPTDPEVEESSSPASSPSGGDVSSVAGAGGLKLVLRDEYVEGSRIKVRLRNDGSEPFIYNTEYEACDMTYVDAAGREFLIPPGTHCDIIAPGAIEPGATVTLFTWRLDECVKDEWGCQKERPLHPGSYTVRGSFEGADSGENMRVEASFRIVPDASESPLPSPTTSDQMLEPQDESDGGGGGGAERRT